MGYFEVNLNTFYGKSYNITGYVSEGFCRFFDSLEATF